EFHPQYPVVKVPREPSRPRRRLRREEVLYGISFPVSTDSQNLNNFAFSLDNPVGSQGALSSVFRKRQLAYITASSFLCKRFFQIS
ncbi:hypothetical protein, partial [uncultured Adlercreutzia sp.]|uniref:hypothetical protein n=1 Tax=uncultured Adlercreutzia sp. TaxID=875803 RepID=UPI0025D2ED92